eukprot:scaffold20320_cov112-Skeletonema_dohrnii-CCMP3373.AAC.3
MFSVRANGHFRPTLQRLNAQRLDHLDHDDAVPMLYIVRYASKDPSKPKLATITMSSSARPTKKAKKSATGQAAAAGPSAIDDLTALTTAQLYSLSAKRHRDYSREIVRMAQEERDRAHVALQEMQSRLERGEFYFNTCFLFTSCVLFSHHYID